MSGAIAMLLFIQDGAYAFISNIVGGTVLMIATADNSVSKTFKVGKRPNGITDGRDLK